MNIKHFSNHPRVSMNGRGSTARLLLGILHLSVCCLCFGEEVNSTDNRVVGGVEVEPGRYPYTVAVVDGRETAFCAGTLIASNWVLSAAHCAEGRAVYVQVGRHNLDFKEEDYENIPVEAEVVHPNFCPDTMQYDFALFRLEYDSSYDTVTVASEDINLYNGRPVTVMGWGAQWYGGPNSPVLLEAEVNIIENTWCDSLYQGISEITDDMLCAVREGFDACDGDSGGPLIANEDGRDTLVGVVSWGTYCGDAQYPGVYGRVSKIREWIGQTVQNGGKMKLRDLIKYRMKRLSMGTRRMQESGSKRERPEISGNLRKQNLV